MPIVKNSSYKGPFWLDNNHLETIIHGLLRKPKPLDYKRHGIHTGDNDFLDHCYPYKEAKSHEHFYLEIPPKGGHLGYWRPGLKESWAERRFYQFVSVVIGQI